MRPFCKEAITGIFHPAPSAGRPPPRGIKGRSRAFVKTDSSARQQKTQGRKDAISRVRDIAQDPGLSDDAIHKALIRGLLTQEFGPQIANDAGFQKVIDDVVGVLKADEAGANLLKAAAGQLLE